jgi:hypothetical protein
MSIIGTCGHDITDEWEQVKDGIAIMEHAIDYGSMKFVNAISYCVVCKKCREQYEELGIVLHNEQEEQDWINST